MAIQDLLKQIMGRGLKSPLSSPQYLLNGRTPGGLLSPIPAGQLGVGPQPTPTQAPQQASQTPMAMAQNIVKDNQTFGSGSDRVVLAPGLFDAITKATTDEKMRGMLAELAGQESSYGKNLEHVSDKEDSFGPYHINLRAKRINPATGKPFTKEEAMDWEMATQHALKEIIRTGGLGMWNPGDYDKYQYEIPKRTQNKIYVRGR